MIRHRVDQSPSLKPIPCHLLSDHRPDGLRSPPHNHSSSNTEISKATKDKSKLQKQLQETIEYDEALAHIANQNIEIDLDDGVKVNYAKFQNVEVSKEGKKSKKINLLKKL